MIFLIVKIVTSSLEIIAKIIEIGAGEIDAQRDSNWNVQKSDYVWKLGLKEHYFFAHCVNLKASPGGCLEIFLDWSTYY